MGSGKYDATVHARNTSAKLRDHGTAFAYSASIKSGAIPAAVHATVDPKVTAGPGSAFVGSVMRESCDSDEHPETTPIVVLFDVTGSMGSLPIALQTKLPKLYGLLMSKGYVEHPQMLFGAIGDATCDRVPLQIGQFESDNRSDENLENLYLEGGGGGTMEESYDLAAYFIAKHTTTDAWEKRGKKGYLFLIGDERVRPTIDRNHVKDLIGDSLEANIPTKDLFDQLSEKWNVYFLYAEQGSYSKAEIIDGCWRGILGQNALVMEDAEAVCETIGATIGMHESGDLASVIDDLRETGADEKAIESASRALATVGAAVGGSTGTSDGDLDMGDGEGADRL